METSQFERQFQMWNRFMYMVFGSSVMFVLISLGNVVYGTDWPGFGNYAGGIWFALEFLATLPGFYLLWNRRWKSVPLSARMNTVLGYFVAGWLNLLTFGFITETTPATDFFFLLVGSALLLIWGYIWALRRTSIPRDEMFP